jgi:hypothetical protein
MEKSVPMSTLIPMAACILIACGYLVLSVHYVQEARHIHRDGAMQHKAEEAQTAEPTFSKSTPERRSCESNHDE